MQKYFMQFLFTCDENWPQLSSAKDNWKARECPLLSATMVTFLLERTFEVTWSQKLPSEYEVTSISECLVKNDKKKKNGWKQIKDSFKLSTKPQS